MSEYRLPENAIHFLPPIEGAVASELGWHHPVTNELLVSIRGLVVNNDMAETKKDSLEDETVSKGSEVPDQVEQPDGDGETPPEEKPEETTEPVVEETTGPDEETTEPATEETTEPAAPLFSTEEVDGGVKVTILPPNQHLRTKWTVNGQAYDGSGNEIICQEGDEFVAKSAKGEFKGKA